MKKLLLYLFCILLIASVSYAFHLHGSGVSGGGSCGGVACDDFNRSDGNLSGDWSTLYNSNPVAIDTNEIKASTSGSNISIWDGDSFNNDQYSQAELSVVGSTLGDSGLVVRGDNGGTAKNCYMLEVSTTQWQFSMYDTGNYSVIGEAQTKTISNNDTAKLMINGTTLSVSFNGGAAESYTQTESTLSSGYPGVQFYGTGSARMDDWEGGNN